MTKNYTVLRDKSDPLVYAILTARVRLTITTGFAFYAAVLNPLEIVEANDWCKSICTDGVRLYVNRDFILSLTIKKLTYMLAHEALHLILDHLSRRGLRDRGRWGMAIDYYTNWNLRHEMQKRGQEASRIMEEPTENFLYEETFDDQVTVDDIYSILKKNDSEIQDTFDFHLDLEDLVEDAEGGLSVTASRFKSGSGPVTMTRKEMDKMQDEIKSRMIQMVLDPANAGSVPASVQRLIDELLEPKMDWRELIRATMTALIKTDTTYSRMSRRSFATEALMPGWADGETIDIGICIDTSGSMTEPMLRDLLSETKGIMQEFPGFKIRLWTFDTAVHGFKEFTDDNIDEIDTYYPEGGGGTTFEVNWEFMKSIEYRPERLVFFTDGYPNYGWGDPDYCDVLWIIHGSAVKQRLKPPFGIHAYYEEEWSE